MIERRKRSRDVEQEEPGSLTVLKLEKVNQLGLHVQNMVEHVAFFNEALLGGRDRVLSLYSERIS
eukprot:5802205-Pyramimonas_sp.AAC.1